MKDTPELRFKGFTDAWVQRKLGEIAEFNPHSVLPDSAEQVKIGNFFRTLDDTITLYKRKLDGLKELKRGYLQQMFPQAGENVPRVRFAGFSEPWKQRKLGEVLTPFVGNAGVFPKGEQYDRSLLNHFICSSNNFETGSRIHEKDFGEITVITPSLNELNKIIRFFRNLDEQVASHQTRLDKIKQLKAIYLKKMFI